MKLVIDRARWIRGGRTRPRSFLRRKSDGHMCCLGFLARECGQTVEELDNVPTPLALEDRGTLNKKFKEVLRNDTHDGLTSMLIITNDACVTSEKEDADREKQISKLMKKLGVDVEFVG